MKIERIVLRHIAMPLVEPLRTSFGSEPLRPAIIIEIRADGLTGWGECVAGGYPGYSYETIGTAWHVLGEFFGPAILGREISSVDDLLAALNRYRGHNMARSALQMAVWDLIGKAEGKPLSALLATPGRYDRPKRDRVEVGVSIGIQDSVGATLDIIEKRLTEGYRRIKLKIEPGWDVDMISAVRERYPEIRLMVDANSAYRPEDADHLAQLDAFDLMMIEQPLAHDDLYHHSRLRQHLKTPICLDESIETLTDAQLALHIGACDIINIKTARVGGLWEAREIHDLCLERGVPVWVGGMLETGIGRAANLALASLPGFVLPGDISATDRYYSPDIADPPFVLNADGTITVPNGPGLGVNVNRERLDDVTLRSVTLV